MTKGGPGTMRTANGGLREVGRLFEGATAGQGDGPLLARFVEGGDGRAFEALVDRHGSMVWATCRAVLRDPHDAEDAFQSAFVALARRSRTVRRPESLAPWLHRVAYREAIRVGADGLGGVVDRQRRLGHERQIVRILWREGRGILGGLDQGHRVRRQLAERADHFRMMGMPDQQDFAAALEMDRRFPVHLGDQRTGGVQRKEITRLGVGGDRFGNPMRRKHHRRVGIVGDFSQFLDENGALGLQAVDHIAVMDDFVPDIDGGAIDGQRPFHGVDSPYHPGAKAAG